MNDYEWMIIHNDRIREAEARHKHRHAVTKITRKPGLIHLIRTRAGRLFRRIQINGQQWAKTTQTTKIVRDRNA